MASFLKSLLSRKEPDITDGLRGLGDVLEVTDYCFLDIEGNVLGMVSKYGNDSAVFSYLGREVARMALILRTFGRKIGSDINHCHIQCKSGVILVWGLGASYLAVLLNGTSQIPIVRMIVNVFIEEASKDKQFGKYFQSGGGGVPGSWQDDKELCDSMKLIFGTQDVGD